MKKNYESPIATAIAFEVERICNNGSLDADGGENGGWEGLMSRSTAPISPWENK